MVQISEPVLLGVSIALCLFIGAYRHTIPIPSIETSTSVSSLNLTESTPNSVNEEIDLKPVQEAQSTEPSYENTVLRLSQLEDKTTNIILQQRELFKRSINLQSWLKLKRDEEAVSIEAVLIIEDDPFVTVQDIKIALPEFNPTEIWSARNVGDFWVSENRALDMILDVIDEEKVAFHGKYKAHKIEMLRQEREAAAASKIAAEFEAETQRVLQLEAALPEIDAAAATDDDDDDDVKAESCTTIKDVKGLITTRMATEATSETLDLASLSTVIPKLTTPTYTPSSHYLPSWLTHLFKYDNGVGSTSEVQSSRLTVGSCWAFSGSTGEIAFRLPASGGTIASVGIDHANSGIAPNASAPRKFHVVGFKSEEDALKGVGSVDYGEFVYDANHGVILEGEGESEGGNEDEDENEEGDEDSDKNYSLQRGQVRQYFNVNESARDERVKVLLVKIDDNHGNEDCTCLYRFRIFGALLEVEVEEEEKLSVVEDVAVEVVGEEEQEQEQEQDERIVGGVYHGEAEAYHGEAEANEEDEELDDEELKGLVGDVDLDFNDDIVEIEVGVDAAADAVIEDRSNGDEGHQEDGDHESEMNLSRGLDDSYSGDDDDESADDAEVVLVEVVGQDEGEEQGTTTTNSSNDSEKEVGKDDKHDEQMDDYNAVSAADPITRQPEEALEESESSESKNESEINIEVEKAEVESEVGNGDSKDDIGEIEMDAAANAASNDGGNVDAKIQEHGREVADDAEEEIEEPFIQPPVALPRVPMRKQKNAGRRSSSARRKRQ